MEPTEAMIEAGARALWDQDPHRIRWSELREATKSMARIQARECLRAALDQADYGESIIVSHPECRTIVLNEGDSLLICRKET